MGTEERARARATALNLLTDERLTGMSRAELTALAARLAPAQQAQAAQRRFEQRGGPRRRAPGAGSTGLLSDSDRIVITVVYQRQICSQTVLSDLLGINANSIGQAIAETRQLLAEHHHRITPTALRFTTAAALRAFIDGENEPARSHLPYQLSDPGLTGMPRAELAALTERVKQVQDARNERHRHRRRGGNDSPAPEAGSSLRRSPRRTGARHGALPAQTLTQDTLAELFDVSRRTIGEVVREVGPLLAQEGYTPAPTTT